MPSEAPAVDTSFKSWFNEARYRQFARDVGAISPTFDPRQFLKLTLEGLEERELMDRLRQLAIAFEGSQPGTYREKLQILRRLAPGIGHNFVAIALSEFVARYGLDDPRTSLEALRFFTPFGSAEFAVRAFLQRDLAGTLAVMRSWATDPNEHVRRLASEGSRPRLPWGLRLQALVRDPDPTGPILEALKADPSLYVRKSVANHLNDISRDHPERVLDRLECWDRTNPATAWIVRRALRTLIKQGQPRALALIGVHASAVRAVNVSGFRVSPGKLVLGDTVTLQASLANRAASPVALVVDYVVHYVRASGKASAKVFKWAVTELPARGELVLEKRQVIRDFTTRRHYPGPHRVELQVNGQRLAESGFTLSLPATRRR